MKRFYLLGIGFLLGISLSFFDFRELSFDGESSRISSTASQASEAPPNSDTFRLLDAFGEVFHRIRRDYVKSVEDVDLIESAIKGMVSSLDPHSAYLNPQQYRNLRVNTQGKFGGLGMEVTLDMETGFVKIVSPLDNTPAARADLRSGDLIAQIDGKKVKGLTLTEAVDLMRGPVGKKVTITVHRNEREPFRLTLKREIIKIKVVQARLEGDRDQGQVGYVRLSGFNENAAKSVKRAVKNLKRDSGDSLLGLVLDLRNNPGGLLDQAVAVSDLFLERGEIVSVRGRNKNSFQRFQSTKQDIVEGRPIVILINGASASASEIVAGALKDHRRATIVGEKSFGKGSVQTIAPLKNLKDAALKLTVQHYYTPSGELIHKKGIVPDTMVKSPADAQNDQKKKQDKQLERALEIVREQARRQTQNAF